MEIGAIVGVMTAKAQCQALSGVRARIDGCWTCGRRTIQTGKRLKALGLSAARFAAGFVRKGRKVTGYGCDLIFKFAALGILVAVPIRCSSARADDHHVVP
jgi:hypothetical protein